MIHAAVSFRRIRALSDLLFRSSWNTDYDRASRDRQRTQTATVRKNCVFLTRKETRSCVVVKIMLRGMESGQFRDDSIAAEIGIPEGFDPVPHRVGEGHQQTIVCQVFELQRTTHFEVEPFSDQYQGHVIQRV